MNKIKLFNYLLNIVLFSLRSKSLWEIGIIETSIITFALIILHKYSPWILSLESITNLVEFKLQIWSVCTYWKFELNQNYHWYFCNNFSSWKLLQSIKVTLSLFYKFPGNGWQCVNVSKTISGDRSQSHVVKWHSLIFWSCEWCCSMHYWCNSVLCCFNSAFTLTIDPHSAKPYQNTQTLRRWTLNCCQCENCRKRS